MATKLQNRFEKRQKGISITSGIFNEVGKSTSNLPISFDHGSIYSDEFVEEEGYLFRDTPKPLGVRVTPSTGFEFVNGELSGEPRLALTDQNSFTINLRLDLVSNRQNGNVVSWTDDAYTLYVETVGVITTLNLSFKEDGEIQNRMLCEFSDLGDVDITHVVDNGLFTLLVNGEVRYKKAGIYLPVPKGRLKILEGVDNWCVGSLFKRITVWPAALGHLTLRSMLKRGELQATCLPVYDWLIRSDDGVVDNRYRYEGVSFSKTHLEISFADPNPTGKYIEIRSEILKKLDLSEGGISFRLTPLQLDAGGSDEVVLQVGDDGSNPGSEFSLLINKENHQLTLVPPINYATGEVVDPLNFADLNENKEIHVGMFWKNTQHLEIFLNGVFWLNAVPGHFIDMGDEDPYTALSTFAFEEFFSNLMDFRIGCDLTDSRQLNGLIKDLVLWVGDVSRDASRYALHGISDAGANNVIAHYVGNESESLDCYSEKDGCLLIKDQSPRKFHAFNRGVQYPLTAHPLNYDLYDDNPLMRVQKNRALVFGEFSEGNLNPVPELDAFLREGSREVLFFEDFSSNRLNREYWSVYGQDVGDVYVENGELHIINVSGSTQYRDVISFVGVSTNIDFPVGSVIKVRAKNPSGRHACLLGLGNNPFWPTKHRVRKEGEKFAGISWYSRADNVTSVVNSFRNDIGDDNAGTIFDETMDLREYHILEYRRASHSIIDAYLDGVFIVRTDTSTTKTNYATGESKDGFLGGMLPLHINADGHTKPCHIVVDSVEVYYPNIDFYNFISLKTHYK